MHIPSWSSLLVLDLWTVSLSATAFLVTWWAWSRLTSKLPSGPTPLPIIGNVLSIMRQPLWSYEYFHKLAEKHGGLLTVHVGPRPVLVVNGLNSFKKVFLNNGRLFAGRPKSLTTDIFSDNGKDVAFGQYGPTWNLHRTLLITAIQKFAVRSENLPRTIHENVTEVTQAMVNSAKPFHPRNMIYNIMYNTIAGLCFGKRFGINDQEFQEIMKGLHDVNDSIGSGLLGDLVPALAWVPTPGKVKAETFVLKMRKFFQSFIDEHKVSFDRNNIRDMLDAIILAQIEVEEEGKEDIRFFTDLHLRQTLSGIFFAATDTTSHTLLWAIAYAVKYPQLQAKMQDEIDECVGRNVLLTSQHRTSLPFTEAFILETMRIRPVVPLSLIHVTTGTVQLDSYTIPKGTLTLPNLWSCHHDAQFWPEPDKFLPERFLDASGKKINASVTKATNGFVNFSMGKRACPGEPLGRLGAFLVFAGLMQKTKLELSEEWRDVDVAEKIGGAFLCKSKKYEVTASWR